ncbi:NAD+ kinase [Usnea florida]
MDRGLSDTDPPRLDFTTVAEARFGRDESHGDSSASESEYQHALEVVFDPDNAHRRRSSLVTTDDPHLGARTGSAERRENTACFVHHLLEKQRQSHKSKTVSLQNINENTRADKAAVNIRESATQSRMLTKRQLADMAYGVRELSKKLGSLRLRLKVKTVFLLTKAHDESLIGHTRDMVEWLLSKERDTPYIVYVEDTLEHNHKFDAKSIISAEASREGRLKYWNNELCKKHPLTFDFAVTLGGDGTLLYASWLFQRIVPPVLSFSLGSLGFLTKFDYSGFQETLTSAFKDGVTVSLRLRFEVTVMRSQTKGQHRDLIEELIGEEAENDYTHKPDGSYEILNDIVVDRGPNPTMSSIEIFGDDEHFTTVQADGICVATPTGSTAYNLAAGGSLCHPENPVILVTAICAHTLNFRPIILPDTVVLRVAVPYDARTSSWASFDGRERIELCSGDYVTISASRYPFANVMQKGRRNEDWVRSISEKLNWNSRQKQKSFNEWSNNDELKT